MTRNEKEEEGKEEEGKEEEGKEETGKEEERISICDINPRVRGTAKCLCGHVSNCISQKNIVLGIFAGIPTFLLELHSLLFKMSIIRQLDLTAR